MWDYYEVDANNKCKAKCKICQKLISRGTHPSSFTTSRLIKHLNNKHTEAYKALNIEQRTSEETKTDPDFYFPPDNQRAIKITRAIGMMMAIDYQPFSIVEDRGFRNLLQSVN